MRNSLGFILLCLCSMAVVPTGTVQAQTCAAPGPCSCTSCLQRQTAAPREAAPREVAPRGYYSRSPDTGEFSGENNSIGVRGFGLRLPSISVELPELRLPSLARYRRGPHMTTDSARAPWVEGRALEFNPVGPERDAADRSVTPPPQSRGAPSCVAPTPRSCDAPEAAPPADTRYQLPANGLNAQDAELLHLREQAVSLQKAIDSLANSRAVAGELSEREQLRRKEREVDELRAEVQRMQSMLVKESPVGDHPARTDSVRSEPKKPQTTSKIRPVSAIAPQVNRSANKSFVQNGVCNGQQCKLPNGQACSPQEPVYEQPIVHQPVATSKASGFRPTSLFNRR